MIEAGAAGVHFEDQLASEKKCGHMGGKVLLPTAQAVRNLIAARLAADVLGVPTILLARTDAEARGHDHERRRPRRRASSSPASAPRRASTRRTRASTRRSRAAWPTRRTPTSSGARPKTPDLDDARHVRRRDPRALPRQAARLQLLTVVQLVGQARPRTRSRVPGRAGGDGLPLPVRDAGRLPRAVALDVRPGPRLPRSRHGRLRRAAAARSSAPRTAATPPRATSARSAPATSTTSRR